MKSSFNYSLGAVAMATLLSGCGGGSAHSVPGTVPPASAAPAYAGPLAHAAITITIPRTSAAAATTKRKPAYVSSGTASVSIALTSPPAGFVQPGTFAVTPGATNATSGVACPAVTAGYACTIPLQLPPGSDAVTIQTLDASSDVLSSQNATFTIATGTNNTPSVVLDAQVASAGCATSPAISFSFSPTSGAVGSECSGTATGTISMPYGTPAVPFAVTLADATGATILPTVPGAPIFSATQSASNATIAVSQNPYQLVVTPTADGTATVTLNAAGATSGDVIVARSITFMLAIENAGIVTTFAGSGSRGSANGTGTAASFDQPTGVSIDGNGNLYVADSLNNVIRKITSAGVVTTLAGSGSVGSADGTGSAASFHYPQGVAVDGNGNVYVADTGNEVIRKITAAGVVSTLAGSGSAGSADGTGTAASFAQPLGVAADGNGNVYVADASYNLIRKITPAGVVSTLAGNGDISGGSANGTGPAASFSYPAAVAVDGSGTVYVADASNNLIRKITPTGVVTTLAGNVSGGSADGTGAAASFYNPLGVAVDGNGNVYVADFGNNLIRKITAAGVVSTLAGNPAGNIGSTDGTGAAASFQDPIGIATTSGGTLYVADTLNNLIREIR